MTRCIAWILKALAVLLCAVVVYGLALLAAVIIVAVALDWIIRP